jgi:two-component system chemotaxis response regulator CheY
MAYEVLVVDDSKTIRAMVKKSIMLSGLEVGEVFEAANGREALEILSQRWIDIVFADVHMPDMNGIELVEAMSKDSVLVSVPVVIVSSDRNQEHINKLQELGVRAYIKKPFKPESFRDVVKDCLTKKDGC